MILRSLILSFIIFTACTGQKSTSIDNESSANDTTPAVSSNSPTGGQLAQYVVTVFEDSKHHLWFGTMSRGAIRYDGQELKYFTSVDGICGMTPTNFTEDDAGNIWIGTHTGLCRFDGKNFQKIDESFGLPPTDWTGVGATKDRNGTIWASANDDVYRYNGQSFEHFELPIDKSLISTFSIVSGDSKLSLHDSKGNYWFAIDGYGALRFDGTNFTRFSTDDGLCSNNVISIAEDLKGNIWFTSVKSSQPVITGSGGLNMFDGETIKSFPDIDGLHENDLYSLHVDSKGNVWVGATGLGVYRYDGQEFKLYKGTNRMDLTDKMGIQDIIEDHNGEMWFGFSGGLFRLIDGQITNVTQAGPWK